MLSSSGGVIQRCYRRRTRSMRAAAFFISGRAEKIRNSPPFLGGEGKCNRLPRLNRPKFNLGVSSKL